MSDIGIFMAIPIPSTKVSTNKIDGVIILYIVRMLRIRATISIQLLINKRNLRRSKISKIARIFDDLEEASIMIYLFVLLLAFRDYHNSSRHCLPKYIIISCV